MADAHPADTLRSQLEQFSLELAFVEVTDGGVKGEAADGDDRRRQLGDLLAAMEAVLASHMPPEPLHAAVQMAAGWCREASRIGAGELARFSSWHPWMEEAATAWARSRPLPPWPSELPPLPRPVTDEHRGSEPAAPAASATSGSEPTPTARARAAKPASAAAEELVTVLPPGADPEFMRLFCAEADDLLRDIEEGVLVLENAPHDADTLARVFRAFHTFKGNAGAMKLVVLQAVAHELESLLDAARRGERTLDRDSIDVVLAGADIFARHVAEATHQLDGSDVGRAISLPVPDVIARAGELLSSPPSPSSPRAAPAASRAPATTAATAPIQVPPGAGLAPPRTPGPTPSAEAASPPASQAPAAAVNVAGPSSPHSPRPSAPAARSVRVDTTKLDSLVDLVGELVIAESMVKQASVPTADDRLMGLLAHLRGITRDLQRTAMSMRMVPIQAAFQKLTRLVRDTAHELGKEIRLVVRGEETELDRTVIEEIGDPLVHMIRNAADHGIEPPSERTAAGKPAHGTIRLEACHQGGCVVIRISDDGRGLDPTRLRAKAIERGLIPADAMLEPHEALELIFAPGFSTAEKVTDLSGRGVGMDVVRRNIERLRGKVEIESTPGSGTTFTIFMPLTLAIIDGLLVGVGGQRFVVPALAVRQSFRPLPRDVTTVQGRGELVDVRGRLVPMVRIGERLGIAEACRDPARGIVVVVEAGHEQRCLLVDELLGTQEVVIKSLGETFARQSIFAGAAILGDGQVGLILDATAMVRPARRRTETAA